MKPGPQSFLCLPGENAREYWQAAAGGGWKKIEDPAGVDGCVFAIEVLALDSAPFWAVAPEDGRVDVAGVAALRWESLGLGENDGGRTWMHWVAGEENKRVLVGTAGLAAESTLGWLDWKPQTFELSPRLYPIPANEAAVWMELGRHVMAFHHGDRLAHFSALSSRRLDADAADEIRDLTLGLQTHGFISKLKGVRVWTECGAEFTGALTKVLATRVKLEHKPAPVLPAQACEIFPPDVAILYAARAIRRRKVRIFLALAALYVAFFAAWAGWLVVREQKLNQQAAALGRRRQEVEAVRSSQTHWFALEAATNPGGYPAELFHRLVSLLPDEGIRLKEFHIELDKLVVSGEASTVNHAKKFQADLTNDEGLRRYSWNAPQPQILEDNRANFRVEGTLNGGGGAHEGR